MQSGSPVPLPNTVVKHFFADDKERYEIVYLFPNPVEAGQTLHVSGNCHQFDAIAICDLCGRALLKATGNAVDDFAVTLPNGFAKGCYIVKLMRNGAVVKYEKLLVK